MVKAQALEKPAELKGKISEINSKVKNKIISRKKRPRKLNKNVWRKPTADKGVVYLSHIPHGFYEDQIEAYFKQFGRVTEVSVPRSKTGQIKGYAFIEFHHPEVAEIAADAMNNYLMFNRLLKAKYLPPKEQKPEYFLAAKKARLNHSTAAEKTILEVKHNRKLKNRKLKIGLEAKQGVKLLRKSKIMKGKLEKLGVVCDFEVQKGNLESILEKNNQLKAKKKKMSNSIISKSEEAVSEEDNEEFSSLKDKDNSSVKKILSDKNINGIRPSKNAKKIGFKNNNRQKAQAANAKLKQKSSANRLQVIKSNINNDLKSKKDTYNLIKKNINITSERINKTIEIKNQHDHNNTKARKLKIANHNINNVKGKNAPEELSSKLNKSILSHFKAKKITKEKKPVISNKKASNLYNCKSEKPTKAEKPIGSTKINKSHARNNSNEKTKMKMQQIKNNNKPKEQSVKLSLSPQLLSPNLKCSPMDKIVKEPHLKKTKSNVRANNKGILYNKSPKQKTLLIEKSLGTKQHSVNPYRKKLRHRLSKRLAGSE